ncbi:4-hydroxy-tetrahydrodipicolinate synthase [Rickettsiales endosymbiont of Stachyamoeba lipophora]|uniref:4-hydroxy-tetrahydrodipicolinate synthase n=1 Tax=Rickettsiales endosymbiont of Stachyamoeba lipophora TaxID=2486578 RepID=UPI0013DE6530|nr:4-hydroxy-tetrahydrodipicolinate synthase [Rickettsiales endosymbiont of Stachyamoeba lipophora]
MKLQGPITALITPFNEDYSIDFESLEKIVGWQVDNKISGLVVNGTTGESPNITDDELIELIKATKAKAGTCPLIIGAGSNSTKKAILKAQLAQKYGANAVLVVCPYYNKPTQQGLYEHFAAIAKNINIPIIIYNIPGRTNVNLEIEIIERLYKDFGNIIGIKESTNEILRFHTLSQIGKDFRIFCGDDALSLPSYLLGACGTISVLSNILPDLVVEMNNLYFDNKVEQAKTIYDHLFKFTNLLFSETNPIPTKFALSKIGLCKNILRAPLTQLSTESQPKILNELKKFYEL